MSGSGKDMDCTVYHSRDPGTMIQNMKLDTMGVVGRRAFLAVQVMDRVESLQSKTPPLQFISSF